MSFNNFLKAAFVWALVLGCWRASELTQDGNFSSLDAVNTATHTIPWSLGMAFFFTCGGEVYFKNK
jgi:hypothetical protein